MLTLKLRDCWLGRKYGGKVEDKDGKRVRTLVLELEEVMLDQRELNALLGEPHAWASLYNDGADEITPFLHCFKSLELKDAIKGAHVHLRYGLEGELDFSDCKLSKIKLELRDGGNTALSCKVKTAPTLDETLGQLFEHFGEPVIAEVRLIPPNQQQDLPLNTHGAAPSTPPPAAKRSRGTRRSAAETVQ